jgi:hypothetical protein
MRLRLGAVPENPDFHPAQEGWRALREPSAFAFTWIASAVGLVVGAGVIALWVLTLPAGLQVSLEIPPEAPWYVRAWQIAKPLLAIGLLILVHELIHAVVHPGFGLSRHTIVGFWPSKLVCYAAYDHEQSRNRFLLCLAMPLVVISLGLWVAELVLRTGSAWLPGLSIVNALFAGGDVTAIALVAWQVPSRATVRNLGWFTWWRSDPGGGLRSDVPPVLL